MSDANRLLTAAADQNIVDTQTHSACSAAIAAVAGFRVIVKSIEISASTAPAAAVSATLKDGNTVIAQYEIPAAAIAPIFVNYGNGLKCTLGNAATLAVPDLGAGVKCSATIHGFYGT